MASTEGVRILRLIEYVYASAEEAARDQLRWTLTHHTGSMSMRSAVLPFEAVEWSTQRSGEAEPAALGTGICPLCNHPIEVGQLCRPLKSPASEYHAEGRYHELCAIELEADHG